MFINMLMNRFKNFRVKISYLTREMTIDKNTVVFLYKKGHSNSYITRSYIFALQGGKKVQLDRENMQSTGQGRKQTIRTKIERRTCDYNRT